MFERLSRQARAAVVSASVTALDEGSETIEGLHLLRALITVGPTTPAALADLGADVNAVVAQAEARTKHASTRAGLTDEDVEAIRTLGVDVDALLAKIAADLGPEALRPRPSGRAGRLRLTGGGKPRFSMTARKSLELALRHTMRLNEAHLSDAHLLVGLIRADEATRSLLAEQGVTETELLEWLRRDGGQGGGAVPAYA